MTKRMLKIMKSTEVQTSPMLASGAKMLPCGTLHLTLCSIRSLASHAFT